MNKMFYNLEVHFFYSAYFSIKMYVVGTHCKRLNKDFPTFLKSGLGAC